MKKRRSPKSQNSARKSDIGRAKKSSPRRRRASTPAKPQRRLYFSIDPDTDEAAESIFAAFRQLIREEDPEASAQLEAGLAGEARAASKKDRRKLSPARPKRSK